MTRFLLSFLCVCVFGSGFAYAQIDDDSGSYNAALQASMKNISDDLTPQESKHFRGIFYSYNVVDIVQTVRSELSEAVSLCAVNNPTMKGDLDARYQKWEDDVNPVLSEAKANINNKIIAQSYASAGDIKSALELIAKTRLDARNKSSREPKTDKSACELLIANMDATQANMKDLLRQTMMSISPMVPAGDKAEDTVETPIETKTEDDLVSEPDEIENKLPVE